MTDPAQKGAARARTGDRLDGITKMAGTVAFNVNNLALTVDVTEGSTTNTSSFGATAAEGDTIPAQPPPVYQPATMGSQTRNNQTVWVLNCGTLPKAQLNQDYTVQVKYDLADARTGNRVTKYLKGTVAKANVKSSGSSNITLS